MNASRPSLRTVLSRQSTLLAVPVLLLALSAAVALVLIATSTPPVTAPAEQGWQLRVEVSDGAGTTERFTVSCPDAAGAHPDPAGACAVLADLDPASAPLAPVGDEAMCTMIYGGPDTATIDGTYQGAALRVELNRGDGCQIARWDALAVLLGR
jgi:hypothetical protein